MQDYLFGLLFALAYLFFFDVQDFMLVWYSKKGGKEQESIQSSTTPDPGLVKACVVQQISFSNVSFAVLANHDMIKREKK